MNRKIVYMILVSLAVVLLVILLWWWFVHRESASIQNTGTFGSAQNAGQNATSSGGLGDTNIGTQLPGQGNGQTTDTNIQLGNVGGGQTTAVGGIPTNGFPTQAQGQVGVPGVIWLSGITPATLPTIPTIQTFIFRESTSTGGFIQTQLPTTTGITLVTVSPITNNPGTVFNPTGINDIVTGSPSGTGIIPNIPTSSNGQQGSGGGSSILGSIGTAVGVGVVSCAIVPALSLALSQVFGAKEAATQAGVQAAATAALPAAALSVSTFDLPLNTRLLVGLPKLDASIGAITGSQTGQQIVNDFMGCMARNIAKIMLNQITNSVVNWINSGFNGSPSFVQNPTQFFQQTADVVAGNYIKSSALSFLCSPFQLQIKIAIAQSYANRNANSCTLTQAIGNINNFMRGNFLSGNWGGFISFVTVPTNNPYGAFLYASAGVNAAITNAVGQKQQELLQGNGFLTFQQKQECHPVQEYVLSANDTGPGKTFELAPGQTPGNNPTYTVCNLVNTTPGTVIAHSLTAVQGNPLTELDMAKSFDEIINALITQLMTRVLQNGLSNVSGASGYSSNFYSADQLQTQSQSENVIIAMQQDVNTATQYATTQQGSIQDIESAQSQLNDLYNCWNSIALASSTSISSTVQAQAAQSASAASSTLASLNPRIDGYNNRITLANQAIVQIQQFESQALSAQSTSELNTINSQYSSARASGQIPTQTDLTNAQQNRVTLQSEMGVLNTQTASGLQQCHAIH